MAKIVFLLLLVPALSFGKEDVDRPCQKIKSACQAAGFKKGKGLVVDCVKKVLDGETVAGVTVEAADLSACQERRESRKSMKSRKGEKQIHVVP